MEEYILKKLEKEASDVIVARNKSLSRQVKFFNNKISHTTTWQEDRISLFASLKKRIVGTDLFMLDKKHADVAVKKLISISRKIPVNRDFNGIAKGPFKYKKVRNYDKQIEKLQRISDFADKGIAEAVNLGAKRCSGILEFSTDTTRLLTSNDVDAEHKTTTAYYSIRSLVGKDASGHKVSCATSLKNFDYINASKEATEIAILSKNPKKIKSGRYDILFSPLPFANIVEQLGNAASIFSVESGLSCLEGKIGKPIGSEKLTLTDSGNLDGGLFSSPFDDEGHPTQETKIIEKGILKNYLHNTSTAIKYKEKSTGNAGIIDPRPSNLVVSPGKRTKEKMINNFKGLWITNLWYTRFQNYITGEFSTIPRDGCFLVKKGELTPVKGLRLSENLLHIARNIEEISRDQSQNYGWEVSVPVFTGHALVKDLNITTAY